MKMKKKIIRIFVNNKILIEISPVSSIYSLKDEIVKKIYKDLPQDKINLYFNGKLLSGEKALVLYGINDNSNITASPIINGGVSNSSWWLYIIYYLCIPAYLIFLATGLPPVIASVFSFIFDKTVLSILKYFSSYSGSSDKFEASKHLSFFSFGIYKFLQFILWLVTSFSTIFFIWITSAFMFFPWLYKKNEDYCNSGLAAKDMGFWVMVVYMIIYGSFNAFDVGLNAMQWLVDDIPDNIQIIKGAASFGIQGAERSWDIAKFSPWYLIPFVGEILMTYHEIVEEGLGIFYGSLDMISTFKCDNTKMAKELCSLLTGLKEVLDKSKGIHPSNSSHLTPQNKSNLSNKKNRGKKIGNKILTHKIMKQDNISEGAASNLMAGMQERKIAEYIRNYKISPLVDLLQRGFCDIAFKDANPGVELPNIPNYEVGSFNRWSSSFVASIFCQITEALYDVTKVVWGIGTEDQVINMVKTGSFSGGISVITIIIFYIYTAIYGSFGGYKYG
jgi:hypothetical protein